MTSGQYRLERRGARRARGRDRRPRGDFGDRHGRRPTELTVGINPGCDLFWETEVQVAPGVASCTANNDYECVVYDPVASAHKYDGQR